MKVKDLMSTDIICVRESATVLQLAELMKKINVGSLPVCDDAGHIKGIVTDRDIVIRALTKSAHINTLTAKDIMSANITTASPEQNIHEASMLFSSYKVRRLPVVEASKIVGMLSLGDVAVKPVYIDEAGDALSAISLSDVIQ